jgi:hypothetical protein
MGQRPSNAVDGGARRRDHRGRSVSSDLRLDSVFDRDAVPSATDEGVQRPPTHKNELIVARIHRNGTVCTTNYVPSLFGALLPVTKCVSPELRGLAAVSPNRVTKCVAAGSSLVGRQNQLSLSPTISSSTVSGLLTRARESSSRYTHTCAHVLLCVRAHAPTSRPRP